MTLLSGVKKIWSFTITQIVVQSVLFLSSLFLLKTFVIKPPLPLLSDSETTQRLMQGAATLIAMFIIYRLMVWLVERRNARELGLKGVVRESLSGFAIGLAAASLVTLCLFMFGYFRITAIGAPSVLVTMIIWTTVFATLEEIIFRGIIFRIAEKAWGSWIALALNPVLFGIVHITGENATMTGTLSAIVGGFWLCAIYIITGRRLWAPIFAHAAWNFTHAAFGSMVSGTDMLGQFFQSELAGPDWATGGVFGPEASVFTFVILGGNLVILYWIIIKRGLLMKARAFQN